MVTTVVIAAFVAFAAPGDTNSEETNKYLDYMKVTYRSNRALFPFGLCKFDFSSGNASNADDARAGRLTNALNAHGVYAFDGTNTRYELLYEDQDLIKNTIRTGNQLRVPAHSFRVISDGQSSLFDEIGPKLSLDGIAHKAQIDAGMKPLYRDFLFPIDLWHPNPVGFDLAYDIEAVQKGEYTLAELVPKISFEGHDVVHFSFRVDQVRRSYWVDLTRGAVPLQIVHEVRTKQRTFQFNHDDLCPTKGGGWLPRQVTLYVDSHKLARRVSIRVMEFDRPPGPSTFRMDFPEPIAIVDTARNFQYPPHKSWSLMSLPLPNSSGVKKIVRVEYEPAPVMPGERTAWPPWSIILVVAGVILLIATLVLLSVAIKRRR